MMLEKIAQRYCLNNLSLEDINYDFVKNRKIEKPE